jgi:hypothetical protein
MSCKKVWEPEYLEEAIGKTYTSTTFKKNRAEVYLDYEKNQLAHTQSLVVKFKRDEELILKIQELNKINKNIKYGGTKGCVQCMGGRYRSHWCKPCEVDKDLFNYKVSQSRGEFQMVCLGCKKGILDETSRCRSCKKSHCEFCFRIHEGECPVISCICPEYTCDACTIVQNRERIQEYELQMRDVEVKEKLKFIMNCQVEGCKGYLSTKYKCGLCEKYTCSGCLLVKEEGHECKEDDLSTVKMIREETKACPKCTTRISKIDGCDQMWCVECKTAFSWKTGHIVNGAIHNPHYYDFLRQTQGFVPRADNPCGEVPGLGVLRLLLKNKPPHYLACLFSFHRFLEEVTWACRRINPYEEPLVKNRIYYLINRIDQKKFTQKAFMYYQRSLRFQRIMELLNMLKQVLLDQLSLMIDHVKKTKEAWAPLQDVFLQSVRAILYVLEQKKRSPYTSIREEHFKIYVEHKGTPHLIEEFDMSLWMGTQENLAFVYR